MMSFTPRLIRSFCQRSVLYTSCCHSFQVQGLTAAAPIHLVRAYSSDSNRIVVFGATGQQGGSVAEALIKDAKYKVRAITRDPESKKAKALIAKGAECVKADLEDPGSLKAALDGADSMFFVTAYMHDVDTEVKQGKAVVDAAKAAGIKHVVFSGLENIKAVLGEQCQHFDAKAAVAEYLKAQRVPNTIVQLAFFAENLITAMKPRKQGDEYVLDIPMGDIPMDMVVVDEIGECIRTILNKPDEYKDKTIGLSSGRYTIAEYAAILTKVAGNKKFVAGPVTVDMMKGMGFPGAEELAVMFHFYQTPEFFRDEKLTRKLHPNMPTFEQWAEKKKKIIQDME